MNKEFYDFKDLKTLMERLRNPDNGCPWDIEQTFETIKPHTIEEAYEVADAIERKDYDDLKDELGDLLFQVLFHARIAEEENRFTVDDVIHHVTAKMIFRHPHVFGDTKAETAADVEKIVWEEQKAKEKKVKKKGDYYLDDVTRNLPSLLLANKIQKRIRKVGFQYLTLHAALDKLSEEIEELKEAYEAQDQDNTEEEFGDILFATALLGVEINANPEESLRKSCFKFFKRFNAVEAYLEKDGKNLNDATIEEMTKVWCQIKDDTEKL